MTDAQFELIKVVLDKGMLAIVLVLLGFLFAQRLEKIRAKSAYYNKLAERRIDAYDKIIRGLSDAANSLQQILILVTQGHSQLQQSGSYDLDGLRIEVHKQFQRMEDQINKQQIDLRPELVYVSQEFASEVGNLFEEYITFLEEFFGKTKDGRNKDSLLQMTESFDRLTSALAKIHSHAANEISSGTVAERWKD